MTHTVRGVERWIEQRHERREETASAELTGRPIGEGVISGVATPGVVERIETHHAMDSYDDWQVGGDGIGYGWHESDRLPAPMVSYGQLTDVDVETLGRCGARIHAPSTAGEFITRSYALVFIELPDDLACDPALAEAETLADAAVDEDPTETPKAVDAETTD